MEARHLALTVPSSPRTAPPSPSSESDDVETLPSSVRRPRAGAAAAGVLGLAACAAVVYVSGGTQGLREASVIQYAVSLADVAGEGTLIKWQANMDMCWDVWGSKAGAMVQLWSCSDLKGADAQQADDLKWLIPKKDEVGEIRWAKMMGLCLDNPKGKELQLWYCSDSPPNHIRWRTGADGRIRKADEPSLCVDVTPIADYGQLQNVNGNKLQLVPCSQVGSQKFTWVDPTSSVNPAPQLDNAHYGNPQDKEPAKPDKEPANCVWGDWSDWSICSASCAGGRRFSSRRHKTEADPKGKACEGESSRAEAKPCSAEPCPTETIATKKEAIATTTTIITTTTPTTTTTQAQGGGGWWFR